MKTFLYLLFLLLFLFIGILFAGLFLPNEMKVASSVEISARPEVIFPQISSFSNWKNWSPWNRNDSAMQVIIIKDSGMEGELEWSSDKYGKCKVLFTHREENANLVANFDFGTHSKSNAVWFIEPVDGSTLVNWTFTSKELYSWEKYFALFFKAEVKKLLNQGLLDLKTTSEELKYSRVGEIKVVEQDELPTVIMIDTVPAERAGERLAEMDTYLLRFFSRRELQPAGDAFTIRYGKISDTLVHIAKGYPLSERTWVWRTLRYFPISKGKKVVASHFGSYSTDKAHDAIHEYIKERNLQIDGQHWEVELFDPEVDKDSSLWETKVYYPVR